MKFRVILFVAFLLGCIQSVSSQTFYLDPEPTDVTGPVRLYVDVSADDIIGDCEGCDDDPFNDLDPETNPLYIWTWDPNEFRDDIVVNGETKNVGNGNWDLSNENMKMTQDPDNPDLWYYDYLGVSPAEFYGVPAAQIYETGIWFLVKEKNGNSPGEGEGEQKSNNFTIIPEPVGCFDKVCGFPTTFFQDDFFAILYDTNKEANPGLQGGDAYFARFQYRVNGGAPQLLVITDESKVEMVPEGDGIFSLTMIPEEFFGLGENDILDEFRVSFTKPPLSDAPFSSAVTLFPGCPE